MSGNPIDNVAGITDTEGTISYHVTGGIDTYDPIIGTLVNGTQYALKIQFLDVTDGAQYETGLYTWDSSTATLSRDEIKTGTDYPNPTSWPAGTKSIFVTEDSEMLTAMELMVEGPTKKILTVPERASISASASKLSLITVTQPVDLDQMEIEINAMTSGMTYKGNWYPSSLVFPGGGSGSVGDFYYVAGDGTVSGVTFNTGDNIVALVANPSISVYSGNWSKHDQTDAVQSVAGLTGTIAADDLRQALDIVVSGMPYKAATDVGIVLAFGDSNATGSGFPDLTAQSANAGVYMYAMPTSASPYSTAALGWYSIDPNSTLRTTQTDSAWTTQNVPFAGMRCGGMGPAAFSAGCQYQETTGQDCYVYLSSFPGKTSNYYVPGQTGFDTMASQFATAISAAPTTQTWADVVMISLGGNDSIQGVSAATFAANIKLIYDELVSLGFVVVGKTQVFLGEPPRTYANYITSGWDGYQLLASKQTPIIRFLSSYGYVTWDTVHFNTPDNDVIGRNCMRLAMESNGDNGTLLDTRRSSNITYSYAISNSRGTWNAGSGAFPSGSVVRGDYYTVSGAGTVDGVAFSINDKLTALIDAPSTSVYSNNWEQNKVVSAFEYQATNALSQTTDRLWTVKNSAGTAKFYFGNAGWSLVSDKPDTATQGAFTFNTSVAHATRTNLIDVQMNGTSCFAIQTDGGFYSGTLAALRFATNYFAAGVTLMNEPIWLGTGCTSINSRIVDGPSEVAFKFTTLPADPTWTQGNLVEFQNDGTAKMALRYDGQLTLAAGAVFAGAVSGVTTLSMSGALSGLTSITMNGALSGATTGAFSGALSINGGGTLTGTLSGTGTISTSGPITTSNTITGATLRNTTGNFANDPGIYVSTVANSGTNIAHKFVSPAFTGTTKLASFFNDTTEKLYIDKEGGIVASNLQTNYGGIGVIYMSQPLWVNSTFLTMTGTINSSVASGGTAYAMGTNSVTYSSGNLLKLINNATDRFIVDYNGMVKAGGYAGAYRAVSGTSDTITQADSMVTYSSTSTVTATLPSAVTFPGLELIIKKTGASGTVNVTSVSSQTFDGAAGPVALSTQYHVLMIRSDGANWLKIKQGAV